VGHCAAITRSALGNVSPVPDPKRTAKPTNGIGKGSAMLYEIIRFIRISVVSQAPIGRL